MALITRGVALLVGLPLLVLMAQVAFLGALGSKAVATTILLVSGLIVFLQFIFLILLFFSILGNIQTLRATIASRLPEKRGRKKADGGHSGRNVSGRSPIPLHWRTVPHSAAGGRRTWCRFQRRVK